MPLPDELYQGLGHLIVNESEAALLSGKPVEEITPDSDLTAVAADFIKRGVKNVIITLGGAVSFVSKLHLCMPHCAHSGLGCILSDSGSASREACG